MNINAQAVPLSLYIHIPWCIKKCPYCDFNSHALPTSAPFNEYTDRLIADIDSQLAFVQHRPIGSIFIGGGTPSLLPVSAYARLFDRLHRLFDLTDVEITLEANPGTLEHAPFGDYLSLGVNRLSLGVQSFDNQSLSILGRVHSSNQAKNAIDKARAAGFERLNVDLMHGLPYQTAPLALHDLKTAVAVGATHISWYQLTIEPNTAFYRKPPNLPDDEVLFDIEQVGREYLLSQGFMHYEISAWCGRIDIPCHHNMNYWRFGDYLAVGAGAHGKVTLNGGDGFDEGVYRFSKTRLPKDYLKDDNALRLINLSKITKKQLPFEFMMNGLRLIDGIDTTLFCERTGLGLSDIATTLDALKAKQLITVDTYIRPTSLGFRYLNSVMGAFLYE